MAALDWPYEGALPAVQDTPRFLQAGSNICLDFHGDPIRAKLTVFSDGNHHMALQETLRSFVAAYPMVDVFYLTTPPRVAMQVLRSGCLNIGNLHLSVQPHVFISPPAVLEQMVAEGRMTVHQPFMRSTGIVLLVKKGNPKSILGISDLHRDDVRLFMSNPVTETVSYQAYADCLRNLSMRSGHALDFLDHQPGQHDPAKLDYGETIHHREAPQCLADDRADVAVVYFHLALRYKRIFPNLFDFVWPTGSVGDQGCDASQFNCGLVGNGGVWGGKLLEHLLSDEVASIYRSHGLESVS